MIEPEQSNDFSLTLARGIQVLEIFSPDVRDVTTTDVAARLGLSRAAARRFLLTLTRLGYLQQDKSSFSLTEKIATIGHGQLTRTNNWARVMPDVLELAGRLNESVSISVLEGLDICFVARDYQRRMFSSRLLIGDRLPAHCSAAGKVLLAALEPDHLDQLLNSSPPLQQRTPHSLTDTERLKIVLKQVRIQSWASAEDEMEIGTVSIAVPIFDSNNAVVAALALASHRLRRSLDELKSEFLPVLIDTADKISAKLI